MDDDYKLWWLVSRRGWFKVFPVALFESESAANQYADWLAESFQQSYSVQSVPQAN